MGCQLTPDNPGNFVNEKNIKGHVNKIILICRSNWQNICSGTLKLVHDEPIDYGKLPTTI